MYVLLYPSRNGIIRIQVDVAVHCLGILGKNHQYSISAGFNEAGSWKSFDLTNDCTNRSLVHGIYQGCNQITSILTGLGDTSSPPVVVFCWDRISTVQSTTHTTSGTKRGNKVVSDCCTKRATTLISPKMNPSPLRKGIEASSSVLRFSINLHACTCIYDSMFIQGHFF